jgi:L-ascorbate metabolism protein UlaG (beta-lactamase superfamily)
MRLMILATFVAAVIAVSWARASDEPLSEDRIATDSGPLVIHPVEHATAVFEWNGRTIYLDPVGGAAPFAVFPKADLILITDIHGDHLSAETIDAVSGETTTIVAPAAVADELPEADRGRVRIVGNGEAVEWEGITIEAVPMYNLTADRQQFHPKGRGNGYVLTLGGKRIYISGDTEDIPEMRQLENIDVAFVCMNLPYTMDVEAAADAVLDFKPKIVYPYHYRGKGGMSDLEEFRSIVGAGDGDIEVRLLKWY